jgi:hypothetical protein
MKSLVFSLLMFDSTVESHFKDLVFFPRAHPS